MQHFSTANMLDRAILAISPVRGLARLEAKTRAGMRRRDELDRSRDIFDLIVWVDASKRLSPEPLASMELCADDAGWISDNNGPADAPPCEVAKLITRITEDWLLSDACARHG